MLKSLLQLVAQGGISSFEDLARRLSVPPPLLEAMLADLVRLGYLRPVAAPAAPAGCPSAFMADGGSCPPAEVPASCASCRAGCCAVVAGPKRAWTLTEKGARAAARRPG